MLPRSVVSPSAKKNPKPQLVALSLFALLITGAWAAGAQEGKHALTPDDRAMVRMSHDAVRIFDDTGKAENALAGGNKAAAQTAIEQAMTVRNNLATTARAHNLAKVVPIYSEVEQSTALDTMMARRNNNRPVAPAKQPVTVDNVNDQFTFVGIDLDKTKARLTAAQDAIRNNNLQAAKDALNAIGEDLVVARVGVDAPLLAVRENLALAQAAAAASHGPEATAALQQASSELKAYVQNAGSSSQHGMAAQQLRSDIDHMLSTNMQRNSASAPRIGNWWSEVNGWMQSPGA